MEREMKEISIDDIQRQMPHLIDDLQSGRYRFILRHDGEPVAALLAIDDFEAYLDLSAEEPPVIQKALTQSEEDYKEGRVCTLDDLRRSLKPLNGPTDA